MKQLVNIFSLVIILLISACSAKQSLENGNYDVAIKRAVSKLQNKPHHPKSLNVLSEAYNRAEKEDLDKINNLKKQGNPANWDKVFGLYQRIINRQTLAKSAPYKPPSVKYVSYRAEQEEARTKATEYHYALGKKHMNTAEQNRFDARAAYYEFKKVENYQGKNYKENGQLLSKAQSLGMTYVFFRYENASGQPVPKGLSNNLENLPIGKYNSSWVNYHNQEKEGVNYHNLILLKLDNISVSPERIKEIERTEKREITTLKVRYDDEGKIIRDTLGKPIKVKVKELIFCDVLEVQLAKSALVNGSLHIVDVATEKQILTEPVAGEMVFQHLFAKAFGNLDALSPTTIELIKIGEAPFPPDGALIEDASAIMATQAHDILSQNSWKIK